MGTVTVPLISVAAQNSPTWTQRTADISDYVGKYARLVILYQSGSSYTGDIQFDDFNIGGNTFDPNNGTEGFETNAASDDSQTSSQSNIQTDYDAVTWEALGTNVNVYGKFIRDAGGTPSSSTGLAAGNTGSYYFYAETSSNGSLNDIWLRSPRVKLTNSTLSFYSAQYGSTMGGFYAYLEVSDGAVYGGYNYGDGYYSATKYVDAVATATASANVTPTGNRIQPGDASISASASGTADSVFVIDASAQTIQGTATTASAAVEVFDGLASGGGSAAGSTATGIRVQNASATASPSATVSADAQRIGEADSSVAASASITAAGLRIGDSASLIEASTSGSVSGVFIVAAQAEVATSLNIDVNYIRLRFVSGSTTITGTMTATAIEKWEPISTDSQTWDTISESSTIWNEVA